MIKILFVCHGNICRSPMAEFVFLHQAKELGLEDRVCAASAATSCEELGNPVHPGTRRKLEQLGISCRGKRAVRLQKQDYACYDYLIGMDRANVANMLRLLDGDPEGKVCRLLDFTAAPGDILDPWYTGDFEAAYRDICAGCRALLGMLFPREASGQETNRR